MTLEHLKKEGLAFGLSPFEVKELMTKFFPDRREGELPLEGIEQFLADCRKMAEGYPLQYLLGEWEFYGLPLYVGEGVLIPRQDTETLIDTIRRLYAKDSSLMIGDFCAGSGAISIALAHFFPQAQVVGVELSSTAGEYFRRNVALHQLEQRVSLQLGDVLEPLSSLSLPMLDILVSNPPYISSSVIPNLSKEVHHEPMMALDGGEDGLLFYRHLISTGWEILKDNGLLLFEIGYDQGESVSSAMEQAGYQQVQVVKDLTGNDRCVYGYKGRKG